MFSIDLLKFLFLLLRKVLLCCVSYVFNMNVTLMFRDAQLYD